MQGFPCYLCSMGTLATYIATFTTVVLHLHAVVGTHEDLSNDVSITVDCRRTDINKAWVI